MTTQDPIRAQDNGKAAAIVSYLTIIGWLISYFALYKDNKTSLASFHLRQSLLLHIVGIVLEIVVNLLPTVAVLFYVVGALALVLLIFWILGLIGAIQEKETPIPVIGSMAQSTFSSI